MKVTNNNKVNKQIKNIPWYKKGEYQHHIILGKEPCKLLRTVFNNAFMDYLGEKSKDPFISDFLRKHLKQISKDITGTTMNYFRTVNFEPHKKGVYYKGRIETDNYVIYTERSVSTLDLDIYTDESKLFFYEAFTLHIKIPLPKDKQTSKKTYIFYKDPITFRGTSLINKEDYVDKVKESLKLIKDTNFITYLLKECQRLFKFPVINKKPFKGKKRPLNKVKRAKSE